MSYLRVGAASLNQTPMDWEGNRRRIIEAVEEAKTRQVQVLCLPELCLTGYGCEDMFLSSYIHEKAMSILRTLQGLGDLGMVCTIGLPVQYGNSVYNTVCVIQDGLIRGFIPKQNLAQDGVHYEHRWFRPWHQGKVVKLETNFGKFPFGDLVFDTSNGVRIGFEVCEDAWVADRPGSRLAMKHVDLILNPSASHFAFHKQAVRRRFVIEGSRAFASAYVYANLLGNESGRIIYDGATLIASNGELLQEGRRFSFKEKTLIFADIDLSVLRTNRFARSGFDSDPEDLDDRSVVDIGHVDMKSAPSLSELDSDEWERGPEVKENEFSRAVALGLFDYMRKTHVNGYVVSLSGGADSSAVACLVSLMRQYALEELSEGELEERCPQLLKESILTTIYQATSNSSQTTSKAAKVLAQSLSADHMELNVDQIVQSYQNIIGHAADVDWHWDVHDITLQNIQARARAPSAWMVANLRNQILLATSNRSEAAVGYATMDGDTAGGISPISGIDKEFLLHWLRYMEGKAADKEELDRFSSLKLVNEQKPTAELRPESEKQTDEGDLMPYPVLDLIEGQAIRDRKSPAEVMARLLAENNQHSAITLAGWVIKFFRLWSRNQWKRERYAPGFHLDDKNLDPKTWCRFPILSSGFEEELESIADEYLR